MRKVVLCVFFLLPCAFSGAQEQDTPAPRANLSPVVTPDNAVQPPGEAPASPTLETPEVAPGGTKTPDEVIENNQAGAELPVVEPPADDPAVQPAVDSSQPEDVVEAELRQTPIAEFDQRSRDEVWLISSRHLGSRNFTVSSLEFKRRLDGNQWQTESLESFLSPSKGAESLPVVIYIHGNRNSRLLATRRGLQTYDRTFLDWKQAPSVRFVIWTWPSDRIPGNIRDIRTKASRAEQHAFHLARLLGKMKNQSKVAIIGYSYGGRLAINALHLAGGGSVNGCRLMQHEMSTPKVNLTLMAPAIRNDCFCGECWMALKQIDHLFLLYNSQDPYLRYFRFAKFDGFNHALGYTGIRSYRRGYLGNLQQFNAARRVGPEHDYLEYITDKRVEAMVRRNILPDAGLRATIQTYAP